MEQDEQSPRATPTWREPWARLVLVILAVSAALRAWLVLHGGQFFWWDETRYYVAREGIDHLWAGERAAFCRQMLEGADHLLFKILALVPAAVQSRTGDSMLVPAFFFATFSVLNIFLVWRIARAAGAGTREAALAALLLACANSNFYYARHLLPYDTALTFGLLALLAGWTGPGGWRRSLASGALAALCFLTYNGYWLFGGIVLAGHVLLAGPDLKRMAGRAGLAGLGLALPIALFVGLARWLAGVDLVAAFQSFSRHINQGDFGRGWKLGLEYFWAAEGLNAGLALAGLLLVAGGVLATRRRHYGWWWVAGALGLAAGLLLGADCWHKFVIYGRTARQIVPLACLAGAFALERLWRTEGAARRLAAGVVVLVLVQAAVKFAGPLAQVFPPEFKGAAAAKIGKLQQRGESRQLVVLYAEHLLAEQEIFGSLPDHEVVLAAPHPLQFIPYLCEGADEKFRGLLGRTDIRMQLVAINGPYLGGAARLQLPHPGTLRLTLRLPADRTGLREPLLATGKTGAADLVYLIYDSPTTIRLGFDHWGTPGLVSAPLMVDYGVPVQINLAHGALQAEPPDPRPAGPDPRRWLQAEVNGQPVWSQPAEFYPAPVATISFGANFIGASTCGLRFTGAILAVEPLGPPPGP